MRRDFHDDQQGLAFVCEPVPRSGLDSLLFFSFEFDQVGIYFEAGYAVPDDKGFVLYEMSVQAALPSGSYEQELRAIEFVVDEDEFAAPYLFYPFTIAVEG